MPEPGDEAVRDTREADDAWRNSTWAVMTSRPWSALDVQTAFAEGYAVGRASERAKWDAVKQGYVDAAATIEAEFRHYRERFEPIMEEAVASERAKVEALVEAASAVESVVLNWAGSDEWCTFSDALDAVRAGRE